MLKYFPAISYDFGTTAGTVNIVDIFKCVNIKQDTKIPLKITNIEQAERPDQTSYKLYNTFDYYWVLLLTNGIKNPLMDWNNNLFRAVYLDDGKCDKIKTIVRDTTQKITNIKISEL